jgi:acyl-CoA reductase-like NAD-dependent aldehyde dehydrogenase
MDGGQDRAFLSFAENPLDGIMERARWAAGAFADLDRETTLRIARAVAEAGHARAQVHAEWAVRETGFGVVAHKKLKNELCSRGVFETYAGQDLVGPVAEPDRKLVRLARPAGVILALTPSTNPIATLNFKAVLAMLTRNAIILSPHPMAKGCSADAADHLAEAARRAGAPDGAIQVIREPTIPLVDAAMADPRVNLVLATGGPAMVRASYRSGHPALGVGPGNAPAYVHESADPVAAARRLIESKSFDNSILCTNESVVLADGAIADRLLQALRDAGAHVCTAEEAERLCGVLWDAAGAFNVSGALGKDAAVIARLAGIPAAASTRILVVPIGRVQPEEPFAREKLAPVLGFARVDGAGEAGRAARAMMRRAGRGHSAAFHGRDEAALLAFARATPALRVAVNVPLSQGAAGFGTALGPTMTVGTGFAGGSSLGENLRPEHLINWVQIAYAAGATPGRFEHLSPWRAEPLPPPEAPIPFSQGNPPGGPVGGRRAPVPGVDMPFGAGTAAPVAAPAGEPDLAALRAEIRALVLEELRAALQKA